MCEGVWGSVREGENKDPRAIARARGGEHRDVGRERLSTYVERERRGVRVKGEGEGREGRGRCQVTWRRACQHAPSGLPEKHLHARTMARVWGLSFTSL